MKIDNLIEIVKNKLDDERFIHSYGVYEMAIKLSNHYKADTKKVKIAAIFHDYAKLDSIEEQIKHIPANEVNKYKEYPVMYHSLAAAYILRDDFNINDLEIINAIKYHVWGSLNMSLIAKIVLISDKIEEGRNYPKVEHFRKLAFINLNLAIIEFLEDNIEYNIKKGFKIHPEQYEIINKLKEELNE